MRWEQCRESELMSSSKGVDISKGLCPMTLRSVPMACHEWSKFSIFFIVRQHSSAVAYGLRTLQVAFRTKVVVPPKMKALFLPALTVERSARNALGSEHVETLVSKSTHLSYSNTTPRLFAANYATARARLRAQSKATADVHPSSFF